MPASSCLIRTIINRAYYAALISARDFTASSTRGEGGHKNIVQALKDRKGPYIANKLESMRINRMLVDYEMTSALTERHAQAALSASREVLFEVGCAPLSAKPYTENYLNSTCFLSE